MNGLPDLGIQKSRVTEVDDIAKRLIYRASIRRLYLGHSVKLEPTQ
jgi:hypothetical protein